MVNFNGELVSSKQQLDTSNRSFLYGDGVFETLRIRNGKILFLEDHYFRLMASMRIVRMEIPMVFTMEFFEAEILKTVEAQNISGAARARITVYRNEGGFYLPITNTVSYVVEVNPLDHPDYTFDAATYEVDLYKDFFVSKQLLSSLKTTNKMIHITGSIFAKENDLQNCLLLNDQKNVIEALQGNLFMLLGKQLITPPVSEGCLNGILRKKVLGLAKKIEGLEIIETVISPFDLQKADELFITNVISGIRPITKYRKKEYRIDVARQLFEFLNDSIQD
ncbi:aminotransferase class IV [Flavobacterium sp. CYK-4]|uniref:aminotransferase class IV n=1 Tax=Flavobacterium lotistagni TaxID=2709660 RepID=UPI00140C71D5|nr:aminotransferase class IV [Flavobacterium lotistagni]NHM07313.1 aminotransferase class IV [Flavobacterium lotistagni]